MTGETIGSMIGAAAVSGLAAFGVVKKWLKPSEAKIDALAT